MNHHHSRRPWATTSGSAGEGTAGKAPVRLCMLIAVAACLLLNVPASPGGEKIQVAPTAAGETSASSPGGIVPLVIADDLNAYYLGEARAHIKDAQYAQAIVLLQALISKHDSGMIPVGDGGRQFVSLWRTANQLIGSMPQAGLRHYRILHDPPAQRLYELAAARYDTAGLQAVVRQYFHSSYGAKALDSLGAIYFDRGRFSRAAWAWRQSVRLDPEREDKPLMLAKIATAHHLAGDAYATREVMRQVTTDHAGAEAVLDGKKQKIIEFLKRVLALEPAAHAPRDSAGKSWSGFTGAPDGLTVMDSSDVMLGPHWRRPALLATFTPDLLADMAALKNDLSPPNSRYNTSSQYRLDVSIRNGHLRVLRTHMTRRSEFYCPPALYPVVTDELILCRTDQAVTAYDMFTGETKWSSEAFPMYRNMSAISGDNYSSYFDMMVGDRGWNTVTVAEGKVFALGRFRPAMRATAVANATRVLAEDKAHPALLADSSTLAAMSVKGGKKLWEIGYGAGGSDEILRTSKFISVPTHHNVRLYVMATHGGSYYLLCLAPSTGELLWKTNISQIPIVKRGYGPDNSHMLELGSPPAVSDGQVFVTTNAGVVAAVDGETGETLWAHQYPSAAVYRPVGFLRLRNQPPVFNPANPVIVTRGQVICLPADSSNVLALSVKDGSVSWETDRKGQRYLAAIDESRILLSAPGQLVLATAKRAPKRQIHPLAGVENRGIVGRAAITATEAISSGPARLCRLNLADYHSGTSDLGHSGRLLGNLVSSEGKLIAANAAGLCVYFNFEHARKRLSERILTAAPSRRPALVYQRAQLTFDAKRFEEARDDLLRCAELAKAQGDGQPPPSIRALLYRTYVAMGNRAKTGRDMLAMFREAQAQSATDQEKAHMLLRLAKHHEQAGDHKTAAVLAQGLGETYATEQLVDVEIGPQARDMAPFGSDRNRIYGRQLAHSFINRLIEAHGQDLYARFDKQAVAELAKARKAGDPEAMVALARRWKHSTVADAALFAAAEIYYTKAMGPHEKSNVLDAKSEELGPEGRDIREQAHTLRRQADALFGRALGNFSKVANRTDSDLRLKAIVAAAIIHARRGREMTVAVTCDEIRSLCKQRENCSLESEVSFGKVSGTVESILKSVEAGELPAAAGKAIDMSSISVPLWKIFAIADPSMQILRDEDNRPVRMGRFIFLIEGSNILLFDTLADNAEAAVRWTGIANLGSTDQAPDSSLPSHWRIMGTLSENNKSLVVADRKSVAGLDVQSGRVQWRKDFADIGVSKFGCISTGEGVMLLASQGGNMVCLDLATGAERWQARLELSGRRRRLSASPHIGEGVIIATDNSRRAIYCHSLKTGKLLAKWSAQRYAQAALSGDGYLVLVLDEKLSVRELAKLNAPPIWETQYTKRRDTGRRSAAYNYPAILAVSAGRLVVSPSQFDNKIEVLSLKTPDKILTKLETRPVAGQPGLPADAWIDNDNLYVACSTIPSAHRRQSYGRFAMGGGGGLSIQRLSLATARQAVKADWNCDVDIVRRNVEYVMTLAMTDSHVVVFSKSAQNIWPLKAMVIDARTGKACEKVDLLDNAPAMAGGSKRQLMVGSPAVTNDRICVETREGITVYGGQ